MQQLIESFRTLAEFLVQTHESECIYFTTDLEKYDFVTSKGFDLFKAGDPLVEGGLIKNCIKEKKQLAGTIPRNVYGKRLKLLVRPIIIGDRVTGAYGVFIYKLHRVAQAFNDFAEPLANAFPEGAFLAVTDLEKITHLQNSEKFKLDKAKAGDPVVKGGVAEICIRTGQVVTRDLDAGVYGVVTRAISIPLFDPDEKNQVGTFNLTLPRALAQNLQELAGKLSATTQEIASVVEEVAASAGEVSINESQLSEKVKDVVNTTAEIHEVLDFIRNVADQTKMLGLNAAIEAARAGEHGRGFGVVAEEIRKLSDQSKETADRIRKLIHEIDTQVKDVSEISEGTLKQSQEQAAATEQVTASILEIAQMAEKLTEAAQSV